VEDESEKEDQKMTRRKKYKHRESKDQKPNFSK